MKVFSALSLLVDWNHLASAAHVVGTFDSTGSQQAKVSRTLGH